MAVYCPPACLSGKATLAGSDHVTLHVRRIRYAQEALFGPDPHLPGWYTRELLGTPFWGNVQNFPFTPPRLAVFALDPAMVFAAGVNLAAVLAAAFTFLYCRRLGLGPVAAAAAGWTFACSGFFAGRILPGHLPLLEAYAALPLLLWLVDRAARPDANRPGDAVPASVQSGRPERWPAWNLLALGLATTAAALAGHPQLPAYAAGVAAVYAVWLGRLAAWRSLAAMGLGVGVAGFAVWPMALLVGRSTRILGLDPAGNDVPLPAGRLLAFMFPWRDGWPMAVERLPNRPFTGHPTVGDLRDVYFWETVCYVGWLPLAAAAALAIRATWRLARGGQPRPAGGTTAGGKAAAGPSPLLFLAVVGVVAVVLAMPAVQAVTRLVPGTFLRCPSRQLYVATFALAVALAAGCDHVLRWHGRRRLWPALVGVALAAHAIDLSTHARAFVIKVSPDAGMPPARDDPAAPGFGQRVAVDSGLVVPINRQADDVGFFDSIMLAGPYRLLLGLAGAPPRLNVQYYRGAYLSEPALAFLGVRLVITQLYRSDLPPTDPASAGGGPRAYVVPDPAPRAAFVARRLVRFGGPEVVRATLARVAGGTATAKDTLILPGPAPSSAPSFPSTAATVATGAGRGAGGQGPAVTYRRPSSDEIVLNVTAPEPGYVRIIEAADPGWSARVDGRTAAIATAFGALMAVPVEAGTHEVRLTYQTPGARPGLWISAVSLLLLVLLAARRPRAGDAG